MMRKLLIAAWALALCGITTLLLAAPDHHQLIAVGCGDVAVLHPDKAKWVGSAECVGRLRKGSINAAGDIVVPVRRFAQAIPFPGPGMPAAAAGGCVTTPILITATGTGGTAQWSNTTGCTNFTIQLVAPGGSGGVFRQGSGIRNASGGGGGAYSAQTSITLSGTGPWNYNNGAGGAAATRGTDGATNGNNGAADTWFCNASVSTNCTVITGSAVQVGAKAGLAGAADIAATVSGGAGGALASGVGATKLSGGKGGDSTGAAGRTASGGGGAGGSTNDGTAGVDNATVTTATAGGAGGAASGGAAGAGGSGVDGTNGSNGTLFDATHGAGGGGGGSQRASANTLGGNGGQCGAGGGGAGVGTGVVPTSGAGGDGCILITPVSMLPANDNFILQLRNVA